MINKPVLEKLLLDYASGNLSSPETLIVAAHLALHPASRAKVSAYEDMGGALIADEEPSDICTSCLESVLQKINTYTSGNQTTPCEQKTNALAPDRSIPVPIHKLLAESCAADPAGWSNVRHGIEKIDLRISACPTTPHTLYLMRIAPGQSTPAHRHNRLEMTLVLDGECIDGSHTFRKGDITIIQDETRVHSPIAGENGCVCLVLTGGPLRFTAPSLRIWNLFSRF